MMNTSAGQITRCSFFYQFWRNYKIQFFLPILKEASSDKSHKSFSHRYWTWALKQEQTQRKSKTD